MRITHIALCSLVLGAFIAFTPAGAASETSHDTADTHTQAESHTPGHSLNWFDFTNDGAPPIVALVFNFACLIVILYFILRNGLSARFKNRKEDLEGALAEAAKMKEEAEKAIAEARGKIDAIDLEMARLREEILGIGKAESERIIKDAQESAARIRSDAQAMVQQEISRVVHELREEVVGEIILLARERIQANIQAADQEQRADNYMAEMMPQTSLPPSHIRHTEQ